jgi:hypothetical protein
MKGMGRVYDHVTPEMERQILTALEERWVASVLALEEDERQKLLAWVPVIKDTVEKAQQETAMLAAKVVGVDRLSQISPTGPSSETGQGAKVPPGLRMLLVELRGFEPLTSSMPSTPDHRTTVGPHPALVHQRPWMSGPVRLRCHSLSHSPTTPTRMLAKIGCRLPAKSSPDQHRKHAHARRLG